MKYTELKNVSQLARSVTLLTNANHTQRLLSNRWAVRCVRYLTYRGDNLLFYLVDPKGISHGGYSSMRTFVPWAMKFMEGQ